MEILQVMGLERVRWCETDLVRLWKSVENAEQGMQWAGEGVGLTRMGWCGIGVGLLTQRTQGSDHRGHGEEREELTVRELRRMDIKLSG
jgi:hypothetical protein